MISVTVVGMALAGPWSHTPAAVVPAAGMAMLAGGVGSLLPSPPAALKRFMGHRYGAFIHWGSAIALGKEIIWVREVEMPAGVCEVLYM